MTHKNRQEGSDEYATPPSLWRPLARAVGGFDVDPASGAESTPIADVRYTEDDDGLSKAWHGDAWLNPPFGDSPSTGPSKRERWLQKARQEANRDEVRSVSVLLPVDTSTQWFHNHVVEAPVLCLMGPGRMEFEGEQAEETGNTSFATCIAVFGDPPNELLDALEQFGAVFRGREFHASTVQKRLITDGGHRAPCEAVENMDPTPPDSFYDLERRVCPNCRLYFDVGASTDKVFCSDACRRRHERGELIADGGTDQLGDGTHHWDTHCSRCGDEYPREREERLCESCVKEIQRKKLLDGIRCPNCDGEGYVYGTICDLQRAMNGRDQRCPECHGTGTVAWKPDLEDVHPDLRMEVKVHA